MPVRIDQFQAFPQVLDSDSRAALVLFRIFREIAVFQVADNPVAFLVDIQVDERWLAVADSVFEGILDKRDKQQGSDQRVGLGGSYFRFQLHMFRQADTHQFHIITDEIQLFFQ